MNLAPFADALLDPALPPPPGVAGADAARRFAVYRNNVAASLVAALGESFVVVRALLGPACFDALALEYARAHPPRSPLLIAHGAGFPAFLAAHPAVAALPFLGDVATLEWLRLEAFHAEDAASLAPEAFEPLLQDPDALAGARARLHPACRWLRSRFAAHAIWQAHQGAAPEDARLDRTDPLQAQDVLVVRPALEVGVSLLPPGGARLLDALRVGATLSDAIDTALGEDRAMLASLLSLLIAPGVLAGILTPSRETTP